MIYLIFISIFENTRIRWSHSSLSLLECFLLFISVSDGEVASIFRGKCRWETVDADAVKNVQTYGLGGTCLHFKKRNKTYLNERAYEKEILP